MSPAQLHRHPAKEGYVGTAVDVWAAGVLLSVMLLGAPQMLGGVLGIQAFLSSTDAIAHHASCSLCKCRQSTTIWPRLPGPDWSADHWGICHHSCAVPVVLQAASRSTM